MTVDMLTGLKEEPVSRVQLALNVSDVDTAVEFYSRLFGAAPAKRRPGYANFAIEEPALKLVLIENAAAPATLNHLGIEVGSSGDVAAAQARLSGEGFQTATEENVSCCYAVQDKVWVSDPDGSPWEIYTVLGDASTMGCGPAEATSDEAAADPAGAVCCSSVADGC